MIPSSSQITQYLHGLGKRNRVLISLKDFLRYMQPIHRSRRRVMVISLLPFNEMEYISSMQVGLIVYHRYISDMYLQLSDFHPVQSHTLGPSTSFSCPPLTVVSSSAGVPTRRTYAAMQNGQGVTSEEEGKILWQWSTPLDDTTGASGEKRSSSVSFCHLMLLASC